MIITALRLAILGWCNLINMGLLIFSSILVVFAGKRVKGFHTQWFHLQNEDLAQEYFRYLGSYKLLIPISNFVPHLSYRFAMN